ncbi:S8 family serine peptidase [uncultured Pseudokineococcus sp.]|uniref:S8 family serine peptidase n=1 Tax=uncultured Pseudokineococcus sp. TaxID=1642928 RepID=UPI002611A53C|nr:S8 family serine peptidase [uncultured Pseudokineococcus sp.]
MHPRPSPGARSRRAAAVLTGLGLVVATVGSVGPAVASPVAPVGDAAAAAAGFTDGRYVVTLLQEPAATYEGGVAGLEATKPAEGEKLDAESPAVQRYQEHLETEQEEVAEVVDAEPEYQYTAAVNGFSADLTAEQAATLALQRGVVSVQRDEARSLDTIDSPAFLGLTGEDGVWAQLGGPDATGEGVVVGVIDSGITPENPSFAGEPVTATQPGEVGSTFRTAEGNIGVVKADGDVFEGACETGPSFTADLCNDKLVSARFFADGFVTNVEPEDYAEFETLSPRDGDGHGTHTASTAAGNDGVAMAVGGRLFGEGSGMAPGAKLATYKVCFEDTDEDTGGCYTSDSVAAIDQAVLDGVDVLNYSISGALDTSYDAVELAFLGAASAGVFVAASAGNSGPTTSTVAHNSPWLTTVAASTHHYFYGTVRTGDGELYRGISVTDELPDGAPALLAADVAATGVATDRARLCYPGSLDPAQVGGTVVVCDRGTIARVDKSLAVEQAGGVGMVLANTSPSSLDADVHYVPTVHVDEVVGAAIKAYVREADAPTISLLSGDQTGQEPQEAPVIAGFSSRGPALAHEGDLLKPDISAPGVSVLAAVAPGPNEGRDFDFLSGTSMSSPHVAGLGALILGENPEWSPMAVKSAMMTTAYDLKNEDGTPDTNHFNGGAGHVDPTRFLEPGLVYESDVDDWLSFLENTEEIDFGIPGIDPIDDPSDLNQPSIAVGTLAGRQTVERTVTATTPGLYRVQADMPGFDVRVTPRILNFTREGQSKSFEVRITRTTAPLDAYGQGSLTWQGRGLSVRSPIVARPTGVAAPTEVSASVADGEVSYDVRPSTSEPVGVEVDGFVPATRTSGDVASGVRLTPLQTNASTDIYPVDVPEGASVVRFDLTAGEGADDLDLYVTNTAGAGIASSATGSADERVTVRDPAPGRYLVHVHAFSTARSGGAYDLDTFVVAGPEGNASTSPNPFVNRPSYPRPLTVSWDGLEVGTRYLGAVRYEGASVETLVALD